MKLEAINRFDEPLTGYHIVSRKTGNPVMNTPSFETKEQAQKYLMTKMFANHQDYKVVHTSEVGVVEGKKFGIASLEPWLSAAEKRNKEHSAKLDAQTKENLIRWYGEEEFNRAYEQSGKDLTKAHNMLKKQMTKEDKQQRLPSMVSSSDKFNLMCDGENFILRSGGKRIAKMSHASWNHIADAVKNRTTVTTDGYALHQKGDSYTISDTAGNELAYLTATEMDKLIDDGKKYLETTKVVEETSILKIAEMKMSVDKKYANFDTWKKAVMAHHPQVSSKLRWHGRVEGGKSTISAEVPGQDRSYGVWDSDKNVGVVLEQSVVEPSSSQDVGEYDQEGDMAKIQLRTIITAAQELHDALGTDDNLPEWVQSKLTLAEDYVTTVRDYLKARTE
jgi:hypothetical protein